MTIIIGAGSEPAAPNPLPTVEVDLPHPASVPENHRLLDEANIIELMAHDHPLVRGFAVEQAARDPQPALLAALVDRFADDDENVAVQAITLVELEKYADAADRLIEVAKTAKGARLVAAASAISKVAPDRLLETIQGRGRLDGPAYRGVLSALATTATEPVRRFFDKALNRSGALTPERRSALHTAVLLGGDPALSTRVLAKAIDDSKDDAPEEGSFPSRVAMGVVAGLPMHATRSELGAEVFKESRTFLLEDVVPALPDEVGHALLEAANDEHPAHAIKAMALVLEHTASLAEDDAPTSVVRRRRGLLEALVARSDAIAQLEPPFAALFLALAVRAAATTLAEHLSDADSEGTIAVGKALELSDPATLASMSEEAVTTLFAARSRREVRRVVTALVRQPFRRPETLTRLCKALVAAGHGRSLLEAVGEVEEDTGIHEPIVHAISENAVAAERLIVEVLTETPLPEDVAVYALMLATRVRTERVAVAIGRRYYDLRAKARSLTSQAVLRAADVRLLPLVESRAFEDEPEALVWAVLSLVHDAPSTEALERTIARVSARAQHDHGNEHDDRAPPNDEPQLEVLLECEVCGETLRYRFERALVDPDAKDQHGDPAFVGPLICKACGAEDRLKATPETASVLTEHMLAFLQAAQRGEVPESPPLVTPARTTVAGRTMGLAAALRWLDEEVKERPDSIRARLNRARTRMILKRPGVESDLEEARRIDPQSVEVDAMLATHKVRLSEYGQGIALAVSALGRLREGDVRLYDVDEADELIESLEGYLLELSEQGLEIPPEVDLSRARRTRDRRLAELRAEREAHAPEASEGVETPAESEPTDREAAFRTVSRNDPCPCGSGKKFKRCHGR